MSVVIPLSVFAGWPKPNLIDPEMRGPDYIVTSTIFFTISLVTVSTRLWYKTTKGRLWWDDFACVAALAFTAVLTAVIAGAAYRGGWRNHLYDIIFDIPLLRTSLKLAYVAYIFYAISATLSRLACLLLYYRLFASKAGSKAWTYTLHGCIISIVACNILFGLLTVFGCRPIKLFWTVPAPADIRQHCVNVDHVVFAFSIINVAQDLLTTVLPIPVVFRLQMPLRQRVGVIVVLTISAFAMICAAIKCHYIWLTLLGSWDRTWHILDAWVAGLVEINVIITCSCAPALKPLLAPFATKALTQMGMTNRSASRLASRPSTPMALNRSNHLQSRSNHVQHKKQASGEQSLFEETHDDKSDRERGVVITRTFLIDHDESD